MLMLSLTLVPLRAADKPLNQIAIHYKYNDGDFAAVIQGIEEFTHAHKTYARADSVFIAKHLAVVYAASPETRERGKYYMFQLLELVPSAELVDMYVSDEIEAIFSRVRQEYATHHQDLAVRSEQEREEQEKDREARKPLWKKPWVWAAGAGAAVGVTAAILLWPESKPRPEYVVQ
jgi:hypothetical protein